jgi:hypothetical protein
MEGINRWWEEIPGERFWLGITGRVGNCEVLAEPLGTRRHAPAPTQALITHVRDGDLVFRYDEANRAIVAWSTTRGRVKRKDLAWCECSDGEEPMHGSPRPLPSWAVRLKTLTPLDRVVQLDEIARIQWDLYPALRALEDRVGGPIYYPFAMVSASDTRLLAGYVFKLPALFVQCFPALARVGASLKSGGGRRSRVRLSDRV